MMMLLFIAGISACSNNLTGTWKIQKYETSKPGEKGVMLKNIGTMTYFNDGTGQKDIRYTVLGISKTDTLPFLWTATENSITIDDEGSEFAKTWIILENKRKFQQWKSTDGTTQVQLLELVK